jgi:hypothetical protein
MSRAELIDYSANGKQQTGLALEWTSGVIVSSGKHGGEL